MANWAGKLISIFFLPFRPGPTPQLLLHPLLLPKDRTIYVRLTTELLIVIVDLAAAGAGEGSQRQA
jgi:hypothetical protein